MVTALHDPKRTETPLSHAFPSQTWTQSKHLDIRAHSKLHRRPSLHPQTTWFHSNHKMQVGDTACHTTQLTPQPREKIFHYLFNEILEKFERNFFNVERLQARLSLLKLIYGLSKQHICVFRRYLWTCTVVSQIPWLYIQVGYRGFYFKFTRGHICIWGKKCYGRSYHQPAFCDLVETLVLKTQNVGFWYDLP